MQLVDKFGYLSVDQIRASPFDGLVAYLPKQGGQGTLAVITAAEAAQWKALAVATPPAFLVLNYEDQQADWMAGGWAVGVAKGHWIKQQLAAVGLSDIGRVYASADFHPGASLSAVMDCLRGLQSVLGDQLKAVYGFVETLDEAKRLRLADHFWLCGSQSGLAGRPWINMWQHNNDQGAIAGVTCDINDVLLPDFGQWQPTTPLGALMALTDAEQAEVLANSRTILVLLTQGVGFDPANGLYDGTAWGGSPRQIATATLAQARAAAQATDALTAKVGALTVGAVDPAVVTAAVKDALSNFTMKAV